MTSGYRDWHEREAKKMRFTEVENERCAHAGTRRELDEANDRSAELEVALERYGLHESECNKIMAWHDPDELKTYQSCSCGLHDVLGFDPALREGPTPTIDRNLTIERLRDENTAIRRAIIGYDRGTVSHRYLVAVARVETLPPEETG